MSKIGDYVIQQEETGQVFDMNGYVQDLLDKDPAYQKWSKEQEPTIEELEKEHEHSRPF